MAGDYLDEAERCFRNARVLAPDDFRWPYYLGHVVRSTGRLTEAVEHFEQALRLRPDDQLAEAVRLDPRLAAAHFAMGTLYERSGRDREAMERYTFAATHDPNHAEAHLRLADTLRRTDRLEASLAPYRRALELEPGWREARFSEAMALVRLARYPEALQRLRAAMDLHPGEPAFPLAVARLLAAAPDPRVRGGSAALALARAVEETHKTTAVAETMAMALAELGRFAEAVEWQRVAMSGAAAGGQAATSQRMAANLALYLYRLGRPCRTPWRDDDPEHRPGPVVEPGLLDPPSPF